MNKVVIKGVAVGFIQLQIKENCGGVSEYNDYIGEDKRLHLTTDEYEKIKELALTSEAVCGTVYDIWNIVGAEEVIGCLQYMMNIPEDFDTFWNNEVRY